MTVTVILRAFWDWESALRRTVIKRHCHPPRSTPRFARHFAAPNDSHCYSPLFSRLGERASKNSDKKALSSSALHSALRASLCSSEWQPPLFSALFWDWESALRRTVMKRHCHPPRSTTRFARRFAAPNDSHCCSPRFSRLGERASNTSDENIKNTRVPLEI